MVTHVFSNFQIPKILEKKIMQKNLILHFFEMSAFETINKHVPIKLTENSDRFTGSIFKYKKMLYSLLFFIVVVTEPA